jgi:hypothetical protein
VRCEISVLTILSTGCSRSIRDSFSNSLEGDGNMRRRTKMMRRRRKKKRKKKEKKKKKKKEEGG